MSRHWILLFGAVGLLGLLVRSGPAAEQPKVPATDRTAAFHKTIVTVNTAVPNTAILVDGPDVNQFALLAKIVTGVETGGQTQWSKAARQVRVEDFPGGIVTRYQLAGTTVTSEIMPLPRGRGAAEDKLEGAALYTVKTDPPTTVTVRLGAIAPADANGLRVTQLAEDSIDDAATSVTLVDDLAILHNGHHPYITAVRGSAPTNMSPGDGNHGQIVVLQFPQGAGQVLISYARDLGRARELAQADLSAARQEVSSYYDKLLANIRLDTPDCNLNDAFRAAAINLEYDWLAPYGWIESARHWLSLWHMQVSMGADWLGQTDRSRECILALADRLLPTGAVPQLSPGGGTHREIFTSGSNPYFMQQVRHYWDATGDRETIARLAPVLEKVIEQTFDEWDRDGDGLLAWGQQIGNQEDYTQTPYAGTAPTIEGICMLRLARDVFHTLGDEPKSQAYARRADRSQAALRRELWMPDLGRFMYYKDPRGAARLDGAYQALIYPVIYGITNEYESYTSIRHLRDRMMGPDGVAYCSNHYTAHQPTTSGNQGAVAQQPWAARGLAAVGLRNEAWRPLKATADWVMGDPLRGAWPEVDGNAPAAYFSPPAGLYVQAVVEALFGLKLNKPENTITVSPCFPDAWTSATLTLPEYKAAYQRNGNEYQYTIETREPLARHFYWMLPPGEVESFTVNGIDGRNFYKVFPYRKGVGGLILDLNVPSETRTQLRITFKPVPVDVKTEPTVAEDCPMWLTLKGPKIIYVDDPNGLLTMWHTTTDTALVAHVRPDLLNKYLSYERLGQMNFSRRTLFLECRTEHKQDFIWPVDLTILPRCEASASPVVLGPEGGQVGLRIRNNHVCPINGTATLELAGATMTTQVNVPERSEVETTMTIPRDHLSLLAPGENKARLTLPGVPDGLCLDLTVLADKLYAQAPELTSFTQQAITPVALPESLLKADDALTGLRRWYPSDWLAAPWDKIAPSLASLAGKTELEVPGLPCVKFQLAGRRMIPVSYPSGQPSVTLPLGGEYYRKLYLLVLPYLDNHDGFSKVARLTLRSRDGVLVARELTTPGDLDWAGGDKEPGFRRTWSGPAPRPDRFGLLPLLQPGQTDWPEAHAPEFPQPKYWATCLPCALPSTTLNVVEIGLDQAHPLESLTIETLGADAALGLVAACGERPANEHLALLGDKYQPAGGFRSPRVLFRLDQPGNLEGWRVEGPGEAGPAFGVREVFGHKSLNSLAGPAAADKATGKAVSPDFKLDGDYLDFQLHGGGSTTDTGPGALAVRLVDAQSGEVLARLFPIAPGQSGFMQQAHIPLDRWRGRAARLELIDNNPNPGLGWIGLTSVTLTGKDR